VEQKAVEQADRTNVFLPLVSNTVPGALKIVSDAAVSSSFLEKGYEVTRQLAPGWGAYLYVLEGGPVLVNGMRVSVLASAMITDEREIKVRAEDDTELLLVEVKME